MSSGNAVGGKGLMLYSWNILSGVKIFTILPYTCCDDLIHGENLDHQSLTKRVSHVVLKYFLPGLLLFYNTWKLCHTVAIAEVNYGMQGSAGVVRMAIRVSV